MTVRFFVPEGASHQVALGLSPALEAVLSLHVLVEPKHHPLHHEWVRTARRRLPQDMKRLIAGFKFAHINYVPPVLLPPALGELPTFDSELERFRALGAELGSSILDYFVRAGSPAVGRAGSEDATPDLILERAAHLGPSTLELTRLGLEHPDVLAEQFVEFIERYWNEAGFSEEWARVEPRLAELMLETGRQIASVGLFGMLEKLRPKVGVNRERGEFWVRKEDEEEILVSEDVRLVFAPSAFLWPHIGLVSRPPDILGLVYPAPFAKPPPSTRPDTKQLLAVLRAVADETRLGALRMISERPRSTQELALLLGLSEASVSRHLRMLVAVGLLETHRDSHYMLYRLIQDRIHDLGQSLQAFLHQPPA